jgi:plasmid stabilization system protein ParE
MRWKFHPAAAEEYLESCRYYSGIEARLGAAFSLSVESAIGRIQARPEMWPEIEEDLRRCLLKRFPFGLYYTVEDDFLLIVAVLHMRRKPGSWRGRVR